MATYADRVASALLQMGASSPQLIEKYINANFRVGENAHRYIRAGIRSGVEKGLFIQPKGPNGVVKLTAAGKKHYAGVKLLTKIHKAETAPKKRASTYGRDIAAILDASRDRGVLIDDLVAAVLRVRDGATEAATRAAITRGMNNGYFSKALSGYRPIYLNIAGKSYYLQ